MQPAYLILVCCILAGVYTQSTPTCDATSFNFYNGLQEGTMEWIWDWRGDRIAGGTDNAFDGYYYLYLDINGTQYSMSNLYNTPASFSCNISETFSLATYTFTITESFTLYRTFYVPAATSWIRIIDTFRNTGTESVPFIPKFYGNMGSDDGILYLEVTNFTAVSIDYYQSDPAVSMNWAGEGGQRTPVIFGGFENSNDAGEWKFDDIIIPAGESVSVMTFFAQKQSGAEALALAHHLKTMPGEILPMIDFEQISTLINWDLCTLQFAIIDPKEVYCATPAEVSVTVNYPAVVTFDGSTNEHNGPFTIALQNGVNTLNYYRASSSCPTLSTTFTAKVPEEPLSLAVDWPQVTASGGFGGEYSYLWDFGSDLGTNFNNLFGKNVTVTVLDKELCSASFVVPVPAMQASPMVPVASAPGKVSSSTTLTATIFSLVALVGMLF